MQGLQSTLREMHSPTKSNAGKTKADATLPSFFCLCVLGCNLRERSEVRLSWAEERGEKKKNPQSCQSYLRVFSLEVLFGTPERKANTYKRQSVHFFFFFSSTTFCIQAPWALAHKPSVSPGGVSSGRQLAALVPAQKWTLPAKRQNSPLRLNCLWKTR